MKNGKRTCTSQSIWFPPNDEGTPRSMIYARDDSFSYNQQFYAVNGWLDVNINYEGTYEYQSGTMHCDIGYAQSCSFDANSYSCANGGDDCDNPNLSTPSNPAPSLKSDPTTFPTEMPTASTSLPTSIPILSPSSNPSRMPTRSPVLISTIVPSIDPTSSPISTFNPDVAVPIDVSEMPTIGPTASPTLNRNPSPTSYPTAAVPTTIPTYKPTNTATTTYPVILIGIDQVSVPTISATASINDNEIPTTKSSTSNNIEQGNELVLDPIFYTLVVLSGMIIICLGLTVILYWTSIFKMNVNTTKEVNEVQVSANANVKSEHMPPAVPKRFSVRSASEYDVNNEELRRNTFGGGTEDSSKSSTDSFEVDGNRKTTQDGETAGIDLEPYDEGNSSDDEVLSPSLELEPKTRTGQVQDTVSVVVQAYYAKHQNSK